MAAGVVVRGLGTGYPSVWNDTDERVRITFKVVGRDESRSVEIPPGDIAPFHSSDGTLRADIIEIIQEER